jgi:alpha-galactosidase
MSFKLAESPWIRAGRQYHVRVRAECPHASIDLDKNYQDLWTHTNNGTAVRNFTAHKVPPHGVVALLLQDAGDEPEGIDPPCSMPEWCMHEDGTRIDQ